MHHVVVIVQQFLYRDRLGSINNRLQAISYLSMPSSSIGMCGRIGLSACECVRPCVRPVIAWHLFSRKQMEEISPDFDNVAQATNDLVRSWRSRSKGDTR